MSRLLTANAVSLTFIVSVSCASFTAKDDYQAYKKVHLSQSDTERALAIREYLDAQPEGNWAVEFKDELYNTEEAYYNARRGSMSGLKEYLQLYPDGKYVDQVKPQLAALEAVAGRKQAESAQSEGVLQDRAEDAEAKRQVWVSTSVGWWMDTLLHLKNWGATIPRVAKSNAKFSKKFGEHPKPQCNKSECLKQYASAYTVPVPGRTRLDRVVKLWVRLRMNNRNLKRVEILMPNNGFSRWYEKENRIQVKDEDEASRRMAIDWAAEKILTMARKWPGALRKIGDHPATPIEPISLFAKPASSNAPSVNQDKVAEQLDKAKEQAAKVNEQTPKEVAPAELVELLGDDNFVDVLDSQEGGEPSDPTQSDKPSSWENTAEVKDRLAVELAYNIGNLRLVVFSADKDDAKGAYDGFYVETRF